jgi:hypothetical protein
MMRVLFFLVIFFSFSFSLEVHEPLFPEGEELKEITTNYSFGGSGLLLNNGKSFVTFENILDSKIKFFDIDKKRMFFQITKEAQIDNFALSKDGNYLVYDKSSKLKVVDVKKKKTIRVFNVVNQITSLDISQEGKYAICSTKNNKIYIFDIKENQLISAFRINNEIKNIRISASNQYIVSQQKNKIVIYDFTTFQELFTFNIKETTYLDKLEISNNNQLLLFLSSENRLRVWDIKRKSLILDKKFDKIKDAKFTQDSQNIIYGEKNSLQILDIKSQKIRKNIKIRTHDISYINDISISKDDKKVLFNSNLLINLETDRVIDLNKYFNYMDNNLYISDSIFIKTMNSILSKDYGKGIKNWDLNQNRLNYVIEKNQKINDMVVSKDEKYLIFSTDKELKVWGFKDKEIIKEYQEDNSTIKKVAISKNGKYIGFETNNKFKVLDFNTWKVVKEIELSFFYHNLYQLKFLENKYLIVNIHSALKIFDINGGKLVNDIKEEEKTSLRLHSNLNYYQKTFYSKNYNAKKKEIRDIINNKLVYSNFEKNEYIDDIIENKIYIRNFDTNKSYVWDLQENKRIDKIKNKDNSFYAVSIDYDSIGVFYLDENRTEKKIKEIFYTNDYWAIADYQTKKLYRYSDKIFILDASTYQPLLPKLPKVSNSDLEIFFDKKDIRLVNNEDNIINIQVKNISNHIIYWIEPIIDNNDFTFQSNSIIKIKPHEIKTIKLSLFYNKKIEKSMRKDFNLKIKVANNDFQNYVIHTSIKKEKEVEATLINTKVKLINNDTSIFKVKLKNLTNRKLYDFEILINDSNYTMDSNETIILEPNEEKEVQILLRYNNAPIKTFQQILNFKVKISNKLVNEYLLTIEVESKPEIELVDIKLGRDFIVKIRNLTNMTLNNIQVLVSDGNETVTHMPIRQINIEKNTTKDIKLYRETNFMYSWKGYNVDINVSADGIREYSFQKHIDYNLFTLLGPYLVIILIGFIYMIYMIYIGKYNFRLNGIMKEADKIFDIPLHKLPYYKKFLKRRMNKYYYEQYFGYVLGNDIEKVSRFFQINNEEKAQLVKEKVNGKLEKIDENFFEIKLDKNFAIKVKKILLYFSEDTNIDKIYKILEDKRSEGIFIIARNEKEQKILSESIRLKELQNVIATLPRNLKMFLLQNNHSLILSKILSSKLDRKIISPYKTKNGVQNESYFFGREKILQQITEREPSNYLIVGARQIGKTSILFALERIFRAKNELEVIHMTLSGGSAIRKIALKLNMDRDSTLEDIEEYILRSDKRYLFLIDEVDGFIKKEEQEGYKTLDTFRSLTQEGKAYFIMAGFWELYYQATHDYQSPIANFGERITVDKLEDEACLNLLIEPMSALNLKFNNQVESLAFIINSLGKRANLIATVANEIVENLDTFRFEIDSADIQKALNSRKVLENFNSWQKLTDSEFKSYIDRLIVYYTIDLDSFTIRKIINLFKKIGVEKVTIDEIKESLDRLELSYILAREGKSYVYTIPLFQEHLKREDIKAILDEMIEEFRFKYGIRKV